MNCPKCSVDARVLSTRTTKTGITRRQHCDGCGHRFSTREVLMEGGGRPGLHLTNANLRLVDKVRGLLRDAEETLEGIKA